MRAALVVGYALIGACWLAMKTSGEAELRARELARPLLVALLARVALLSVWTPLELPRVAQRWFSWPNLLFLSPVPLVTAWLALRTWRALSRRHPTRAFYSAVGLFVLAYLGLLASTVPYLVPPSISGRRRPRRTRRSSSSRAWRC